MFYVLGAVEAKSGQFCGILSEKHRSVEFLGLIDTMLEVWPDNELYMVMDNYIIHQSEITYCIVILSILSRLHWRTEKDFP